MRDLFEQLEAEEQKRQKVQLEKAAVDDRLKRAEERNAELEDAVERGVKERKQLDDRVAQLAAQCADDEEKLRTLNKQRARADGQLGEVEAELQSLIEARSTLERQKASLDTELAAHREALDDERVHSDELAAALKLAEDSVAKHADR